jgi:hypothetical protein
VLGPVLVNYWNEYQIEMGTPRQRAYDQTMYILAGLLVAGFICNLLVRPVSQKWFRDPESKVLGTEPVTDSCASEAAQKSSVAVAAYLVPFWLLVLIPLGWGVWVTLQQAAVLFSGGRLGV